MIKPKRLVRIEVGLTPKQRVLLWLRTEFRDKSAVEHVRQLVEQPPHAAPRYRISLQVAATIQAAMKNHDPMLVQRAVREGQMEADFLIRLAYQTNDAILKDSRLRWFQIGFLFERLRLGESDELLLNLVDLGMELQSLKYAIHQISRKYFDGECVLLRDAREVFNIQLTLMELFLAGVAEELREAGASRALTELEKRRELTTAHGERQFGQLVAMAKSTVFRDFGNPWAARAVLKPYLRELTGATQMG